MSDDKTKEMEKWDKWFAIECNNVAWDVAAKEDRSSEDNEKMLLAAHTAAFHWGNIGTELNVARAHMLLGHVYGLLGHGSFALKFAGLSGQYLLANDCPDWEKAFVHAIQAHAEHADGNLDKHKEQYLLAVAAGDVIEDAEEKEAFMDTFKKIPKPINS